MKVLDSSIVFYDLLIPWRVGTFQNSFRTKNEYFFTLQVHKRVGNFTGLIYEREGKSVISFCKKAKKGQQQVLVLKISEFTVVKREANFTTRHVKGVQFVERRNTSSV